MKISITGRPGKIVKNTHVIVTAMSQNKVPNLPKDLPQPMNHLTTYILYITPRQWNNVDEAITDPDDKLIVEGYPFFDTEKKVLSVFVTRTTTKALEMQRREQQRLEMSQKLEA
ncbi:hypothetical protein QUF58_09680 [Anaerolineales bacterium HSG24]|nr:hypothetical protein [Anaerolineales bacterium HSG24]